MSGQCEIKRPNGMPCGNPVPEPIVIEVTRQLVGGPEWAGVRDVRRIYVCGECAREIATMVEMPKPGDTFTVEEP